MKTRKSCTTALDLPLLNLGMFALLLHFAWEMLQYPFFAGMADARHADAVRVCARATLGDMAITLAAYGLVAWLGDRRRWPLDPSRGQVATFLVSGLAATIVMEILSTRLWARWSYSDLMPVIPGLRVGLVPLVQWTVVPLTSLWFVRRQLT